MAKSTVCSATTALLVLILATLTCGQDKDDKRSARGPDFNEPKCFVTVIQNSGGRTGHKLKGTAPPNASVHASCGPTVPTTG